MVLKFPLTEREVIGNIVNGLSLQQRSRFLSETFPYCMTDIDCFCMHDQNTVSAGAIRPPPLWL
jgi:hypothetical protein